jgi:restriction endonuclease S subunit
MNFKKNKWKSLLLEETCSFIRGVVFSTRDEVDTNGYAILRSHNVDFENSKVSLHNLKYVNKNVKVKNSQKLVKNDILISVANSKEQTGKMGFSFEETNAYAGGFMAILRPKVDINPFYLFVYLLTNRSKEYFAGRTQGTTNIFNITFDRIKDLPIPIPSIEEQKQIASLFQSIETAIKKIEELANNLKVFWKKLIDEFCNEEPIFGKLLNDASLRKVRYCDVTEKVMRKIDPLTYGIERIVAGENLESEDFKIRTWQKIGEGYLGPAFHVLFKPGDILYGSRRTYLKKVALADFEGVCANTTYVIRAKEELLLQDLLKHIMLSERFTQYSIGVSKGSTNPYINWKDLDNFSFQIPDIETQKEIVKVLDGILNIIEQIMSQKVNLVNLKQKLLNEIFR